MSPMDGRRGGGDIPPTHARKPDPDEPWRYISPCCKRQVRGMDTSQRYRCGGCGRLFDTADLIDRKGGLDGS